MVNWNLRTYTKEEFISAWNTADTVSECAVLLSLAHNGGSYKSLRQAASSLDLTEDHMTRKKHVDARTNRTSYKQPLDTILIENSSWSSSSDLRKRLVKEGVLQNVCIGCDKSEALNFETGFVEPIRMHLDHINGKNTDNRLENLRILCPTCHSFTSTYAGKNRNKVEPNWCVCGTQIDRKSKRCQSCRNALPTSLSQVPTKTILDSVEIFGYLGYSKTLGVSDNTIRKELRRRGITPPRRKRSPLSF